jgi:hypothetical protein
MTSGFWIEFRTILVIAVMLLTPGWAILSVSGLWKRWQGVQRWFMAMGVSIAFYPVLYYMMRTLLPSVQLGRNKLWLMLAVMGLLILWTMRKNWLKPIKMGQWTWLVLVVLGITLFTRLWLAHLYPYPAWTDSLHHSILTHLTASNGQIPYTLMPYDSAVTDMYHLGLYALSGPLEILANIPGHSALLWMGQTLNALCGIGVFLLLDRKVGRVGAIAGMVIAGLVSMMPAYYFNWGRYTQVASQAILLIAGLVTWEAVRAWRVEWPVNKASLIVLALLAALLNAGVFLLHFQVSGYTVPLLVIVVVAELIIACKEKERFWVTLLAGMTIAVLSLALILPALIPAFRTYIELRSTAVSENVNALANIYYFSWEGVYGQTGKPWFLWLAVISLLIGLIRKGREFILVLLAWIILLLAEGFLYKTNNPMLTFTNLSAVLIMLYLPISLAVGVMAQAIVSWVPKPVRFIAEIGVLIVILAGGIWGATQRVKMVEPWRQLMTVDDEKAMVWIEQNTPEDAVFAVNLEPWVPNLPIGTDGGYWILYYTGRKTTAGTMLSGFGTEMDMRLRRIHATLNLYGDITSLKELCALGVEYMYIGGKPAYSGKSFNSEVYKASQGVKLLFQSNEAQVLGLCR